MTGHPRIRLPTGSPFKWTSEIELVPEHLQRIGMITVQFARLEHTMFTAYMKLAVLPLAAAEHIFFRQRSIHQKVRLIEGAMARAGVTGRDGQFAIEMHATIESIAKERALFAHHWVMLAAFEPPTLPTAIVVKNPRQVSKTPPRTFDLPALDSLVQRIMNANWDYMEAIRLLPNPRDRQMHSGLPLREELTPERLGSAPRTRAL